MERRASSSVHDANGQRSIHVIVRKKQNAEVAEYANKKTAALSAISAVNISIYSSSSFTSPRSALAFSIIFSCSCAGTTS